MFVMQRDSEASKYQLILYFGKQKTNFQPFIRFEISSCGANHRPK